MMESIGQYLKKERELRQVSLEELAQTTRIPLKMLRHIEAERFDELPGEVFARGFLKSYARALGLPVQPVLDRYGQGRPVEDPPAPMTAITPPERGRRFGIALAMVILLVLFTLALSIVLRPRHRDTPIELSRLNAPWSEAAATSRTPSSFAASATATPIASSRC